MNRLAAILLVAVTLRFIAADMTPMAGLSAAAIDYVKSGLYCALLAGLLYVYAVLPQAPSLGKAIASLACLIGAVEGLMMSGCRLGWHWMGMKIADLPEGVPLCNAVVGGPVRESAFALYMIVLVLGVYSCRPRPRRPT
ncbi:MAG: hypothetical protein ACRCV9_03490 [Burkholderiaceae bacterium]